MDNVIKYIKEFFYLFSGMTALFACVMGFIALMLVPFGLAIYVSDVLGFHSVIGWCATITTFCFYWIVARHFNWVEGIR